MNLLYHPLHHVTCAVGMLSFTTLRYSSGVIFVTSLDVSHVHLEAGPGLAHRTTPLASVESRLSVIH